MPVKNKSEVSAGMLNWLIQVPVGDYPITDKSKIPELQAVINEKLDFQNDFRLYIHDMKVMKRELTLDDVIWKQNAYLERIREMELKFRIT